MQDLITHFVQHVLDYEKEVILAAFFVQFLTLKKFELIMGFF